MPRTLDDEVLAKFWPAGRRQQALSHAEAIVAAQRVEREEEIQAPPVGGPCEAERLRVGSRRRVSPAASPVVAIANAYSRTPSSPMPVTAVGQACAVSNSATLGSI
jgi:hypothetical protein